MSYCQLSHGHPYHGPYHDLEYGFPVEDEAKLFERLSLEIFQAGLSWLTVLKKRKAINEALFDFEIDRIAALQTSEIEFLLENPKIIRNKLKIHAIRHNGNIIKSMREYGGFAYWIEQQHPLSKLEWVATFRRSGFRFVGGEIVGEFLMSIGYLRPPHDEDCPIFKKQLNLRPPWLMQQ
jgi:DNA-3-methyladenine glycosylase I